MSLVLANRHAFEALGRDLDLDRYTATLPAMSAYRTTFQGGAGASLIMLASAAVSTPAQAALALPMLCFPQVLFGGAIVPVDQMAAPGRLMSHVLANRHAFEALGRDLDLDRYTATLPAMSAYRTTFQGGASASLIMLASFAVALTLATVWVLDRRSRR